MLSSSAIVAFPRRLTSSALRAAAAAIPRNSYTSSFLVNRKCMFSSNAVIKRLGTLRVVGPDGVGLLAASTQVLNNHRCNILKSEQWTDTRENICFQRVSFHYNGVANGDGDDNNEDNNCSHNNNNNNNSIVDKIACEQDLMDLFRKTPTLKALWNWRDRRKKIGILVSKYDHCLWELLLRHKARELDADLSIVISNHETLRPVAETFGIPYHVISPTKASATETATETETSSILPHHEVQQLELLKYVDVDVVILARYMQVLSSEFLKQFPKDGIINIHHSFLPAFLGGSPHRQAHERGVKLIGATAHYTTEVLDDGPIIEQDVINCSHRDSVQQLVKKGRVLERNVLLKAIEAHLDDRIIVHGNRCVVFGD
jgi:formyltetrahydrofolate deformylase